MKTRTRWLASAAAIMLVALAVLVTERGGPGGGGVTGSTVQQTGGPLVLSGAGGSRVGEHAPRFSVTTSLGTPFELPTGTPAVVFFMAPGCASCEAEARALARIHEEYGDRLAVLGVDLDVQGTPAALGRFAQTTGARYGFVQDSNGTLARGFDVRALDTTVITDARGDIVFRDAAPTDEQTLRRALATAGLS